MNKKTERGWRPTIGEILFAVALAIIPWSFPTMGVTTRCGLWLIAWMIFLHLVFSLIPPLTNLPTVAKILLVIAITALGSFWAYYPIVDMWRDEMASALTGRLKPEAGNRSDPVKFQIGPNAKALITWTGAKDSPQFAALGSNIEFDRNEDGELVVNTVIKDREGRMLVEIVDNEWRISSAAWEKNYTRDSLEVKDGDGRIVFQLRIFADRAELQAEWWNKDHEGIRMVQVKDSPDSPESDKKGFVVLIMRPPNHPDDPAIQPIFRYPSKQHFGQFRQH